MSDSNPRDLIQQDIDDSRRDGLSLETAIMIRAENSRFTLLTFCELAEHPAARRAHPRALDSFLVGHHHRIAHNAALVEWLERNQKFQRDSA